MNKEIIGKEITGFYLSEDKTCFYFETAERIYFFNLDGDCCSKAFVQHISGLLELFRSKIISFECIELGSIFIGLIESDWQGGEMIYSIQIKTEKSYADIEFRNFYGAYPYGAELCFCDEIKATEDIKTAKVNSIGLYSENFREQEFKRIVEDF
jgi:hypothetical protein